MSRITSYNVCYTKLLRIKGKEVEPEGMKDVLDVIFLEHLRGEVRDCLGSVQCKSYNFV